MLPSLLRWCYVLPLYFIFCGALSYLNQFICWFTLYFR
nr:MAG TPA: hypothetical protein [Caudoviricetes sp.]